MVLFFGPGAERLQAQHGPSILMAEDPLAFLIDKENSAMDRAHKPTAARPRRKRKSNELTGTEEELNPPVLNEIDDNDPRLIPTGRDSCNLVRKSIREFTGSGGMKVGDFQKAIGVSAAAYRDFMNKTGTWDDEYCDTYRNAVIFFKKREILDLPTKRPQVKKPKTAKQIKKISDLLDVKDIELPGENADGDVPVYDTCDEIRKKINDFMVQNDVPKPDFVDALSQQLPEDRKLNTGNLQYFLDQIGPKGGNSTALYYAAYIFFEKRRVKDGKPKTEFREEMEEIHSPFGVDREHGPKQKYVGSANNELVLDEYARIRSVPAGCS